MSVTNINNPSPEQHPIFAYSKSINYINSLPPEQRAAARFEFWADMEGVPQPKGEPQTLKTHSWKKEEHVEKPKLKNIMGFPYNFLNWVSSLLSSIVHFLKISKKTPPAPNQDPIHRLRWIVNYHRADVIGQSARGRPCLVRDHPLREEIDRLIAAIREDESKRAELHWDGNDISVLLSTLLGQEVPAGKNLP